MDFKWNIYNHCGTGWFNGKFLIKRKYFAEVNSQASYFWTATQVKSFKYQRKTMPGVWWEPRRQTGSMLLLTFKHKATFMSEKSKTSRSLIKCRIWRRGASLWFWQLCAPSVSQASFLPWPASVLNFLSKCCYIQRHLGRRILYLSDVRRC